MDMHMKVMLSLYQSRRCRRAVALESVDDFQGNQLTAPCPATQAWCGADIASLVRQAQRVTRARIQRPPGAVGRCA